MKCFVALAVSVLVVFSCGGCIVRTAANTIGRREVDGVDSEVVYGISEIHWVKTDAGVVIVGGGGHPRAHETYAFFISEPYPNFVHRSLILRPHPRPSNEQKAYDLILLVDGRAFPHIADAGKSSLPNGLLRFEGRISQPEQDFFGRYVLCLDNLNLKVQSDASITVRLRGKMVADSNGEKALRMLNHLGLLALSQEMEEFFRKDPRVKDVQVGLSTPDLQPHDGIQDAWYNIRVEKEPNSAETERQIIRQVLGQFGLNIRTVEAKYNQWNQDRLIGIVEVPCSKIILPGDEP